MPTTPIEAAVTRATQLRPIVVKMINCCDTVTEFNNHHNHIYRKDILGDMNQVEQKAKEIVNDMVIKTKELDGEDLGRRHPK